MSVTLLSRHKEERKAAPALVVERITERGVWRHLLGQPCSQYPYGFQCRSNAVFMVGTLGSKGAFRVCERCLPKCAKQMLDRPDGEAEALEAEKIEEMRLQQAISDAKKAHDAAGLCEARSQKTLSGKCERPPKFLVETPCTNEKTLEKLCAHHTAPWRRKLVTEYVRTEYGDGTVGYTYNHSVAKRLRRIEPILKAVESVTTADTPEHEVN